MQNNKRTKKNRFLKKKQRKKRKKKKFRGEQWVGWRCVAGREKLRMLFIKPIFKKLNPKPLKKQKYIFDIIYFKLNPHLIINSNLKFNSFLS